MKLKGELVKEFFGGEVWVLRAVDGAQYQLVGSVPEQLDGCRVVVRGELAEEQMGISMVGDIVRVVDIRAA